MQQNALALFGRCAIGDTLSTLYVYVRGQRSFNCSYLHQIPALGLPQFVTLGLLQNVLILKALIGENQAHARRRGLGLG